MALSSLISQLRKHIPKSSNPYGSVYEGIADVIKVQWHLGFTAFGGPPVHFQIVGYILEDNLRSLCTYLTLVPQTFS